MEYMEDECTLTRKEVLHYHNSGLSFPSRKVICKVDKFILEHNLGLVCIRESSHSATAWY